MKVAEVQFTPWDKTYYFDINSLNLSVGDKVIVKTEIGVEMGEVVALLDIDEKELVKKKDVSEKTEETSSSSKAGNDSNELKSVLRLANVQDIEGQPSLADKKKALDYIKSLKDKYELPMKFVDVRFAYDGSRITFAFIADGRVDFREMVKDLTRHFGKNIRLQQIGIRDEAKIMGDSGHCGRKLCCRGHLKNLESITSEMAELQQCSHRGSERISGICGRLMCCLAYEQKSYEELRSKMPDIGTKVNVDGKRGVIISHHILKNSVDVEFKNEKGDERTVLEVDLDRNKK